MAKSIELILGKLKKGDYSFENFETILGKRKSEILHKIDSSLDEKKATNKIIKEIEMFFSENHFVYKADGYTYLKEKKVKAVHVLNFNIMEILSDSIKIVKGLDYKKIPTTQDVRTNFIINIRLWEWLNSESTNIVDEQKNRNLDINTTVTGCCTDTKEILKGVLNIGVTQGEFNVFKEAFQKHRLTRLGNNKHRIDRKIDVDIESLVKEIFDTVSLLQSIHAKCYFLDSILKDFQNNFSSNRLTIILGKFEKAFQKRRLKFLKDIGGNAVESILNLGVNMLTLEKIAEVHELLLLPFKKYGKEKEILDKKNLWNSSGRFGGTAIGGRNFHNGYGYVKFEPKENDTDNIRLWFEVDEVHNLLNRLWNKRNELSNANNDLSIFQKTEKEILEIKDKIRSIYFKQIIKENIERKEISCKEQLEEIQKKENKHCKGVPMTEVIKHFEVFTTKKNKKEEPYLTKQQLISFLKRGFLNIKTESKGSINYEKGEKGLIVKRFHEYYVLAVKCGHVDKHKPFIDLLLDCFEGWKYSEIKSLFKPNKTKKRW